jgi:hypothetical protein
MRTQIIKKSIAVVAIITLTTFFIVDLVSAKTNNLEKVLEKGKLPADLQLQEKSPQSYVVTTDYFHKDIFGNFFQKERYRGTYTRALDNGNVKWTNVTRETINEEQTAFGNGNPLAFMENFTYTVSVDMMKAESFPNFPPSEVNAKNLVWDVMGIEGFSWLYFDSLQLNTPFSAPAFNGKIPMEGVGTFENRNIVLTWTGVTLKNDEPCAVIDYLAMDNPLDLSIDSEYFKLIAKGRSHYWGTIMVSLSDKQIEGVTLHEDVILDMVLPDGKKQLTNSTRLITVEKL